VDGTRREPACLGESRSPSDNRPPVRRRGGRKCPCRCSGPSAGEGPTLGRGEPSIKSAGVREDSVVVKGERACFGKRYPRREGRVIAAHGHAPAANDPERHGRCGFPGIAIRSGVNADDPRGPSVQPRLLLELAGDGFLHGLAEFHKSSRERPGPSKGRGSPTNQQHPPRTNPHRIDGQSGALVASPHAQQEVRPVLGVSNSDRALSLPVLVQPSSRPRFDR